MTELQDDSLQHCLFYENKNWKPPKGLVRSITVHLSWEVLQSHENEIIDLYETIRKDSFISSTNHY